MMCTHLRDEPALLGGSVSAPPCMLVCLGVRLPGWRGTACGVQSVEVYEPGEVGEGPCTVCMPCVSFAPRQISCTEGESIEPCWIPRASADENVQLPELAPSLSGVLLGLVHGIYMEVTVPCITTCKCVRTKLLSPVG